MGVFVTSFLGLFYFLIFLLRIHCGRKKVISYDYVFGFKNVVCTLCKTKTVRTH